MAQPRIASRPPRACAACYGQYPNRVHVDFRSAIEGGLIDPDNPRGGHVDWVIVCENCIRNAFELLPEQASQRDALARRAEDLRVRAEEAENYASSLEDALSRRPARESAPAPKPTRPPGAPRRPRYGKGDR